MTKVFDSNRYAVYVQEMNSLWLDDKDLNTPHALQTADLIGTAGNLEAAFQLKFGAQTHDHAAWIVDTHRGNKIVADIFQYSVILELERQADIEQRHSESHAYGAINRRIEGNWEEASGINFSDACSAGHAKEARIYLFQIIGDGCTEDDVECDPLPKRYFELDQAEYMGEGYWADYPPLDFASYEELKAYVDLHNVIAQTGPCNSKIRGWRVIYK